MTISRQADQQIQRQRADAVNPIRQAQRAREDATMFIAQSNQLSQPTVTRIFEGSLVAALHQPFTPAAIKWKVQKNPNPGKDQALVVAYIDARDVIERLDYATGGDWSDDYSQCQYGGDKNIECRLTVCGATRVDVGEGDNAKEAYSDAFKRAAVKFGIGVFLYRLPQVWARCQEFGKTWVLLPASEEQLDTLTAALLAGKPAPRLPDLYVKGTFQQPPPPAPAARTGQRDPITEELFSDE